MVNKSPSKLATIDLIWLRFGQKSALVEFEKVTFIVVTPHMYEVPHSDFHHIGRISCWYLGALDRLGGIYLHGALSLLGIKFLMEVFGFGESHFSLVG
jgi:hypothetical protein